MPTPENDKKNQKGQSVKESIEEQGKHGYGTFDHNPKDRQKTEHSDEEEQGYNPSRTSK